VRTISGARRCGIAANETLTRSGFDHERIASTMPSRYVANVGIHPSLLFAF
jgi:hypothetical protein